jgi:hypothetical protein
MMASYVKYQDFAEQMFTGTHNFTAAGDQFKVVIHSDAPTVATDDELADLTQVTGTGYTAKGEDIQNDMTETSGTATVTGVDVTWTATAGDWDAGRYVSTHNEDSTTDKLVNYWDYGGNFTLDNGDTFTVDFGASWLTGA